jgi:hypothetical protein
MEMEIYILMRLNEVSLDESTKLRLPNWPKSDFIKFRKIDKNQYAPVYWKAAKMELISDFELSIEEVLSENWIKVN